MNLLQKAKSYKHLLRQKNHNYGEEQQQLALAWLKDEISASQLCFGAGLKSKGSDSRLYPFVALALRQAFREKKLKIK